jgi:2'-5' RNA ligase
MDLVAHMQSSDSDSDDENNEKRDVVSIGNKNEHSRKENGTTNEVEYPTRLGETNPTKRHKQQGSVDIIPFSHARPETFQRSTPHRRGHWSGHVKILVSHSLSLESRKQSVQQYQQFLERRGYSGTLVEHENVHISLSKPFSLQVSQVESFVQQLTRLLQDVHSTNLHIDTDGVILINEEQTRSFWCWTVLANPILLQLIRHVDSVLARYQQPTYYDPPHFHISMASFPGKVNLEENDQHGDDNNHNCDDQSTSSSSTGGEASLTVPINQLHCTFGTTKQFMISLKRCNS